MKSVLPKVFAALIALAMGGRALAEAATNFPAPATAHDFYNAGTRLLAGKKFAEAETMLLAALAAQDEPVQPRALYNLGHVRFDQGAEILKKGPAAQKVSAQGNAALAAAGNALDAGRLALAQNDMEKMIGAYLAGHGARRELRAAEKAVKAAMETYGNTLRKWQRAADDFKGAAELNPSDTNATHNAEIVEQGIAKLVDSLRNMQAMAGALGDKKQQLGEVLGQLKGRIPAQNAPPGEAGDDEDGDDGLEPESLAGQKESAAREGDRQEQPLSPDQAGQILDGLAPDGTRRLPMSDQQSSKPKDKTGRNW